MLYCCLTAALLLLYCFRVHFSCSLFSLFLSRSRSRSLCRVRALSLSLYPPSLSRFAFFFSYMHTSAYFSIRARALSPYMYISSLSFSCCSYFFPSRSRRCGRAWRRQMPSRMPGTSSASNLVISSSKLLDTLAQ